MVPHMHHILVPVGFHSQWWAMEGMDASLGRYPPNQGKVSRCAPGVWWAPSHLEVPTTDIDRALVVWWEPLFTFQGPTTECFHDERCTPHRCERLSVVASAKEKHLPAPGHLLGAGGRGDSGNPIVLPRPTRTPNVKHTVLKPGKKGCSPPASAPAPKAWGQERGAPLASPGGGLSAILTLHTSSAKTSVVPATT